MNAPIGLSRYAELNGVRQYLGTQEMADQFNSAAYDFDNDPRRKGSGRRMVANEGFRDMPRCDLLWNQYVARGYRAPKVAVRYTSNHYVGARAVDVGIMTAAGVYDVPTSAEFVEIHEHLAAHGFYWAGQNFGEAWHHEYVGSGTKKAIPGVNQAGDPYYDKHEDKPVVLGGLPNMWHIQDGTAWLLLLGDGRQFKYRDTEVRPGMKFTGSELKSLFDRIIKSTPQKPAEAFNGNQILAIRYVLAHATLD